MLAIDHELANVSFEALVEVVVQETFGDEVAFLVKAVNVVSGVRWFIKTPVKIEVQRATVSYI